MITLIPLFAALVISAGVPHTDSREMTSNSTAQERITPKHIGFFLALTFGDDGDQFKRRLVSWEDTARVTIAANVPANERRQIAKAIDEINQAAGRTLFVLTDSTPNFTVNVVEPEVYNNLVPVYARKYHGHFQVKWDGRGRITSGSIAVRTNITGLEKLRSYRMNFARATGIMYVNEFEKRSLFYRPGSESFQLEPMDRTALRLLAENAELRGKGIEEVRAALEGKYALGKNP